MWFKILFLSWLIYHVRGTQDVLSQLYGVEGRNKVLLCLKQADGRQERSCTGAIVHEEWVAVHAACLRQHPQDRMFTLRVTETRNCSDLTNGYSTPHTRVVNAYFYHPWWDLAIVMINRPYIRLDVHPNSTMWTVSRTMKQHGLWKWMRRYIKAFGVNRDPEYHYKRIEADMISTKAPLFAFFFGILLPPLILLLVFLYIINYTGNSNDVSYKML